MNAITLYLGLDVHEDSITIAIAQPGPKGEIRLFATITNDVGRLEKALERIRKAHPDAHLEVAYEAGRCGFVVARRLKQLKVPCPVAAPSLIPKLPGSPFKTDKRDACAIARLLRAGELTAVYVPEAIDEAIRDLCWKAQNRLHLRFMKLLGRRLQRNKAKVAIARELCGFIWALLRSQDCYRQPVGACQTAPNSRPKTKTQKAFNKKTLKAACGEAIVCGRQPSSVVMGRLFGGRLPSLE